MADEPKSSARTITLSQHAAAARLPAAGVLAVVFPRELARRVELGRDGIVFGRESPQPEAALDDGTVSRRHLEIHWDGRSRAHVVADLDSRNGSWLDGVRLANARSLLRDGAVVRMGGVVAVYEQAPPDGDEPSLADAIPGQSSPVRRLRRQIAQAATDPSPALVIGPTGAGKEHVARVLHERSGRSGPWVAVNVTELSPQLAESQLFGHARGAFTGALQAQPGLIRSAQGGTLLLDEIGELALELQPKLLRVIQEREVRPVGGSRAEPFDVRIIAATQRDLAADVAAGRFRRDLWARLSLWELVVPPLSARRADLLTWVDRLHRRWCDERRRADPPLRFHAEAVEALLLADFPDNLRGIDRLVHRVAVEGLGETIGRDRIATVLGLAVPSDGAAPEEREPPAIKRPPPASAEELSEVLAREGNIVAAARWYGCHRRQVYRWMEAFGIARD